MQNVPLSPSTIEYASLLNYSPRGQSSIAVRSRQLVRDGVKNDRPYILRDVAMILEDHAFDELDGYFGNEVVLVPVPRSAPFIENGLWPSMRICEEIMNVGLGGTVSQCLERITPVRRACLAEPGKRPMPEQHLATMNVRGGDSHTHQFLLIDDFVTRGSIFTACGIMLREAFPNSTVKAFAVVNTLDVREDIQRIVEARSGRIEYRNGELCRDFWRQKMLFESMPDRIASRGR